ncbi:MAG: WD40 repeat domain-containing protein [Patescibacteria group bacterium]
MTEKQQMVLKIVGLIAVAGLMGLTLYFMIFGGNGPSLAPPASEPDALPGGGLPTAGQGSPTPGDAGDTPSGPGTLESSPTANGGITTTTLLTTAGVLQPTVTSNGTVAYYDPRDGKFYTIDADGNVVLLSQSTFPSADSVVFSQHAESAVIEFPDGSNVVYDFLAGTQTTLPSHWEEFSFSDDGSEIATKSLGTDPSNRSLIITSADGSQAQVVAALGFSDNLVDVNWSPDGNVLGFSRTGSSGSAFGQNEVYLIDANGEASGVLIVNGTNFKNIWSPDGANILYSVADAGDDYRASLWYGDAAGDRTGNTRLRISLKTTADKCTFASSTVAYCGVPLEMPSGGGSAPSLIISPDHLYRIDLPSGRSSLAAIPAQTTKMFNLSVSDDGNELYFTDAQGRLNLIQLD